MTKLKNTPLPRRRSGRAAVLAGAALVLTVSAGPGAHADSGVGALDDITQVVEEVAEPVVQPVVQSVQSAVPQPVQEAVEPVVEQVVEPVQPVAEVVEHVAPSSEGQVDEPAEEPAEEPADDPAKDPARTPARGPGGQVAPETAEAPETPQAAGAEAAEPAESAVAHHGTAPGGPTGGHAGSGSGHVGAPGPAAISCPDLPTRAGAASVVALPSGDQDGASDHWAVWNVANALMHLWAVGDVSSLGEVVSPRRGESDHEALELPRQVRTDVPRLDTPGPGQELLLVGLFGLLGLLGLLGALATGVAVVGGREPE